MTQRRRAHAASGTILRQTAQASSHFASRRVEGSVHTERISHLMTAVFRPDASHGSTGCLLREHLTAAV
jgi:hypothetical protein